MFESCADPKSIEGLTWLLCYLTSGKHLLFYLSFGTVLLLLVITAPVALAFGFGGAMAARSQFPPLSLLGKAYTAKSKQKGASSAEGRDTTSDKDAPSADAEDTDARTDAIASALTDSLAAKLAGLPEDKRKEAEAILAKLIEEPSSSKEDA